MRMREEYTYPLVMSCGGKKIKLGAKESVEAYKLYKLGYWNIFRNNSPQLPLRISPTYVLSAKYGLIPHTKKIRTYDMVIVDKKKLDHDEKKTKITVDDMIDKLKNMQIVKKWKGSKKILFIGGEAYKKALEGAGFTVYRIDDFKDNPCYDDRNGNGRQNCALKWYLNEIVPNIRKYKKEVLDRLVKKVSPVIIENLPQRFSNEEYFENMGKSHYEVFSKIATDTTKGAKTKSSRRKLRERKLEYDPYEWARKFLEKIHNLQNQYIEDIHVGEIIRFWIDYGSDYFESNKAFYESSAYMEEEDLERWYGIPKTKADGSPIYDRFAFLELAYRVFYEDRDLSYALREFLISQEEARYQYLCGVEKVSRSNKQYCKSDGYTDRLAKIKEEIQKSMAKAARIVNRYETEGKSYEELVSIYEKDMEQYPLKMKEYQKKIDAINREEREERKKLWTSQKKKLDNTKYMERKKAISVPKEPTKPKFFESTVQQKMGRDTYVVLLDFIGRFLAGIEDRLILVPISKKDAFAYIKKHHSALPNANDKGLMMTLAVQDTDGNIGAVATVNTPTGRWDLADRGADFDYRNTIELTRVASDGSIKGASSMLTGRAIDLLPFLKRGDPNKQDLFVTYSLDSEEGSTYRALRDKGLRPTTFIEGKDKGGGGSRSKGKEALAYIDKIRWEAGSGAEKGNWDLLELVGDKK